MLGDSPLFVTTLAQFTQVNVAKSQSWEAQSRPSRHSTQRPLSWSQCPVRQSVSLRHCTQPLPSLAHRGPMDELKHSRSSSH